MADAEAFETGLTTRLPGTPEPSQAPQPPVPSAPATQDGKVMTLVDHLSELRRRVFISIAAVIVGSGIGFLFSGQLLHILKSPLGNIPLNFLSPGEGFFIYIKLSVVVGIVLAMPVLLYELWAFISPGLTKEERRMARPWVPVALLFFLIGVGVAWFILPYAMGFLLGFQSEDLKALITADNYFSFVGTIFLAFGLTMEFPIILVLLSKVGIITSKRLRSSRRLVILGITIFATVVTPGGDLVSPTVLGIVMYILYELSIILVKWGGH
jgi:sec-independent protein translocase protein TatC